MSIENLQIRRAGESDLPSIQYLYSEQLKHHAQFDPKWNLEWPSSAGAQQTLLEYANSGECIFIVAEANGDVLGYTLGMIDRGHPASLATPIIELRSMHVKEEFRGRGIGQALAQGFIECCRKAKIARIKLEANIGNERTINFYREFGFRDYSLNFIMEI